MKQEGFVFGAWLLFFIGVSAPASDYTLINGQKDFYYGHISYAEIKDDGRDAVVFREGRLSPEIAVLNLPLGPGDVIQTSDLRRAEVQFDNGTILRLDLDSRLKIETILAQSLSTAKKISNLVLERGQLYVMYKKYSGLEIFQVVTPGAAVKLGHNSVALIRLTGDGKTDVQVERGKAFLLYGADKTDLSQKRLNAGQRGIVSPDHQAELADYEVLSDFKAWNESMNSHFQELHEGNFLPRPVRNLPRAVFEFAQKFGSMHGEWLWHDLYGYIWRPYLNDQRFPWGTWAPYINGSWSSTNGEMFWIPAETWGWVPYHLGIWMWDKSKGWVWLPGSMFAPAWAVWEFYHGMYAWRPFYLYDWMAGFDTFWGPSSWAGYYGPNSFPGQNMLLPQPQPNVRDSIRKDQLKKSKSPALPMPKEMKKAFGATLAALKRGDPAVLISFEGLPRHSVTIRKEDFLFPQWQNKVVSPGRLAEEVQTIPRASLRDSRLRSHEASRDALLTIERSRAAADLKALVTMRLGSQGKTASPAFRFRDWNPDVKAAIRHGVEISYFSRTNEVACPELGLSSNQIRPAMRTMTGGPAVFSPASGSHSSSGNAPAAAPQTSRSSGQSRSSGSTGGEKKKN